jgi:hypothetical protein
LKYASYDSAVSYAINMIATWYLVLEKIAIPDMIKCCTH